MSLVIRSDLIPHVSPNVEDDLLACLAMEVELYSNNLSGTRCLLCPFRSFDRLSRLKEHMKHHCAKNMYLADRRSQQLPVVRAYYDYLVLSRVISTDAHENLHLLRNSASFIANWNVNCSEKVKRLLRASNRPVLVRVLTKYGPEYWAKELTIGCIRHSRELYFTPEFADLFLSLLLTNEARIHKCVNALHYQFCGTSKTPGLLPSYRVFWNNLAADISNHESVLHKLRELKYKAAESGEFEIITHDETFKVLFNLIGQEKMTQNYEELHALHTFRGYTGLTIGISAQRSTSHSCFVKAVKDAFDSPLASRVKFLYSDAPLRIYKAARKEFKSLLAVGEDPIHLPIRLEYCSNGKVLKPSVRVRQLHRKFSFASPSIDRFWQPDDVIHHTDAWPHNSSKDLRTDMEWKLFCKCPFNEVGGYESYVVELAKICATYPEYM